MTSISDDELKAGIANGFDGLNVSFLEVPEHYALSSDIQRDVTKPKIRRDWTLEGETLLCTVHNDELGDQGTYEYTRFEARYYRSKPGPGYPVKVIFLTDKVPELA